MFGVLKSPALALRGEIINDIKPIDAAFSKNLAKLLYPLATPFYKAHQKIINKHLSDKSKDPSRPIASLFLKYVENIFANLKSKENKIDSAMDVFAQTFLAKVRVVALNQKVGNSASAKENADSAHSSQSAAGKLVRLGAVREVLSPLSSSPGNVELVTTYK